MYIPPAVLVNDGKMWLVGMEPEEVCRTHLAVHKDLVVDSAPGERRTVSGRLFSHQVVPDEPVLSLLVAWAHWVTI